MAITTINNRAINRADTAASGESWTATSATASDFQAVGGANTPAFKTYMSADQTIPDNTWTKVNFDTEVFDTNSMYDTGTYRFTPTVAGKYFVYTLLIIESLTARRIEYANVALYKNGSVELKTTAVYSADNISWQASGVLSTVIEFNGSSDYVESYARVKTFSGSNKIEGGNSSDNVFGAYKIIE